jgi:oligopeptide transport system permease protein
MLWAVLIGIPLGVLAALKQNTIIDYVTMVFVNLGYAIPNFLLCTLLIYFFAVKWGDVTGFPTNGIESGWKSWVLPAIALGHAPMTLFARIVRGSMLETLQQDYIRTARAKGLRQRRVVGLHVLRNSLIPAVTAAAPLLGFLITGSFIVEFIFGIPGIGRYFVISVTGRDYSVTMGITVMLSVIIIFAAARSRRRSASSSWSASYSSRRSSPRSRRTPSTSARHISRRAGRTRSAPTSSGATCSCARRSAARSPSRSVSWRRSRS